MSVTALHPLRHGCTQCGNSCRGHFISPLDKAFTKRLPTIMETLGPLYPDLQDASPTISPSINGRTRTGLANKADGECLFLGQDNLCRIHKHLGAQAKPLLCRTFPLAIIHTATEIRLGTPTRCYAQHQHWDQGPGQSPMGLTGLREEELPDPVPRGPLPNQRAQLQARPAPDSQYAQTLLQEDTLMHLLHQTPLTLETLTLFTAEMLANHTNTDIQELGELLRARLARLGKSMVASIAPQADRMRPGTHFWHLKALAEAMAALQPRPWPVLTQTQMDYSLYVLREWLFLREWTHHPSLPHGVLVMIAGLMLAAWRAQDAPNTPEGAVGDTFGHSMTAWMRLMHMGNNTRGLISDADDLDALLRAASSPPT